MRCTLKCWNGGKWNDRSRKDLSVIEDHHNGVSKSIHLFVSFVSPQNYCHVHCLIGLVLWDCIVKRNVIEVEIQNNESGYKQYEDFCLPDFIHNDTVRSVIYGIMLRKERAETKQYTETKLHCYFSEFLSAPLADGNG